MDEAAGARLALSGITKQFPGVLANDAVGFSVKPGEIHALLGENGAGKSTLVKMIYGIMQPDAGSIAWNGETVTITSPRAARALGIGMVFQHFSLFEALSVFENIALGMDGAVPRRQIERRINEIMRQYGLALDPERIVETLSVGERQRIEIVRALLLEPKLLIMDEPTSVLTPQEVEQLFVVLRQLAKEGCSILYISHKLHEIKALCDTATILRAGRVVGTCDPRAETSRTMAEMMIGSNLKDVERGEVPAGGPVRLKVERLSTMGEGGPGLRDVGFEVRGGEIFGVAGVAGNGQTALLAALSGELAADRADAVVIDGRPVGLADVTARRRLGLASVPEERNGHSAVGDFSLADNAVLTGRERMKLARGGLVDTGAARRFAESVISRFSVKATGPQTVAGALSGGNLQKFVVGREIMQKPGVFVVGQPTWGVDAGAAAAIHQAIVDLAAEGSAIVVVSQDLDELMSLCDTIAVIAEGRLSAKRRVNDISVEEIGLLMGGDHGMGPQAEGDVLAVPA